MFCFDSEDTLLHSSVTSLKCICELKLHLRTDPVNGSYGDPWISRENHKSTSDVRNVKKNWGVIDFDLERTCAGEHLNLSKSGFISEQGQDSCKSQNIAIRALKGNVLYQIWF